MTDIAARLRKPMVTGFTHPMDAERAEAAAEIERLRRALQEIADYPHNGRTETMLLRGHARMALEPNP